MVANLFYNIYDQDCRELCVSEEDEGVEYFLSRDCVDIEDDYLEIYDKRDCSSIFSVGKEELQGSIKDVLCGIRNFCKGNWNRYGAILCLKGRTYSLSITNDSTLSLIIAAIKSMDIDLISQTLEDCT